VKGGGKMRIQGTGMSMYTNYTSYLDHKNQNHSADVQKNQEINQQIDGEKTKSSDGKAVPRGTPPTDAKRMKGAGGPPPKPPELNLDTDDDDLWSEEEISEFIESENLDVNASNIIGKYDVDGDSTINSNEREAMREDDAFNLKALQSEGPGGPRGNPPPEMTMIGKEEEESSDDTITNTFLKQFQAAYLNVSRDYTDVSSLFDVIL